MIASFGNLIRTGIYSSMPKLAFRLHHMRRHHDEIEMDLLPALVDPEREAVDVGANFFVHSGRLNPIADHKPEMQDDALLQAIESGQDRRIVPYVNNFIFIPENADMSHIIHSLDAILAAKG